MEKNKKRINKKIRVNILLIIIIIFISSCSTYKYKVDSEKNETYNLLRLKVKYSDINNRYSGKILILKQNDSKKIFILNPLGRIYFKLLLRGENTTAIYVKKKKYWTGFFNEFIRKIWGISIEFDILYKIIVFGQTPDNKNNAYSAKIKTINDEDGKPEIIEIRKNNIYLRFKIIKNEMKKGKINFKTDMGKFYKTELNELFEKS